MLKGTTAISAGALTLALSGGTALVTAMPASASPARVADCDGGGDLLSSLTGELCDLVDGVTDTVDDVTGDRLGPVTGKLDQLADNGLGPITDTVDELAGTLDKTADQILGGANTPAPSAEPSPPFSREPAPESGTALLEMPIDAGCLPLLSRECGQTAAPPSPRPPAGRDDPIPSPAPNPSGSAQGARPAESPDPSPAGEPGAGGPTEPARSPVTSWPPASADIDVPPLTPLWPGQPLPELAGGLAILKAVPGRPYDAAGTALTMILLASAIIATRVVQARRAGDSPQSMPLQGLRRPKVSPGPEVLSTAEAGRHRLA